jgi:hypothetical protein
MLQAISSIEIGVDGGMIKHRKSFVSLISHWMAKIWNTINWLEL